MHPLVLISSIRIFKGTWIVSVSDSDLASVAQWNDSTIIYQKKIISECFFIYLLFINIVTVLSFVTELPQPSYKNFIVSYPETVSSTESPIA